MGLLRQKKCVKKANIATKILNYLIYFTTISTVGINKLLYPFAVTSDLF